MSLCVSVCGFRSFFWLFCIVLVFFLVEKATSFLDGKSFVTKRKYEEEKNVKPMRKRKFHQVYMYFMLGCENTVNLS